MKIYAVQIEGSERTHLVKAHTRAGAANYVRDRIKPTVTARLPSQDELVAALQSGVMIEDATQQPAGDHPGGTPINQQDQE